MALLLGGALLFGGLGQPMELEAASKEIRHSKHYKAKTRKIRDRVRRGDSFAQVLRRNKIPLVTSLKVAKAAKRYFDLGKNIRVGSPITLVVDRRGKLQALYYPASRKRLLRVVRNSRGRFVANLKRRGSSTSRRLARNTHRNGSRDKAISKRKLTKKQRLAAKRANQRRIAKASKRSRHAKRFAKQPKLTKQAKAIWDNSANTLSVKVRKGDNLALILARHDVSHDLAMKIALQARPVYNLAGKLRPGSKLKLAFSSKGRLQALTYPMGGGRVFWMTRKGHSDNFRPQVEKIQYGVHHKIASSIINGSLFVAGRKAGLTHGLAVQLASLFEWDVDFARDIRAGDSFSVVYEEMMHDGKKVRTGDIVAAKFINRGKVLQVVRYTDPSGHTAYYNSNGENIQKMFIRAPVDFTRISSHFAKRRKHPVFGFTRAHKGVDYAAPSGTPIRAAGDGKVVFVGYRGGFGNLVLIRHNSKYTTAYAHLSRYGKGIRAGKRVKQGQTIGRVGMTGAATGPHLHYEVRVWGVQKNPLSVQLPSSQPVPRKYMRDFRAKSNQLIAMLDKAPTSVASLSLSR